MEAIGWTTEAVNVPVPDDEDLECARCGTLAALVEPVPDAGAALPPATPPHRPGMPSYQEQAVKLVDLRGIAQPPSFNGEEKAWADWRFRFQTVAALLSLHEVMQVAARHPRVIVSTELSEENVWKGRTLYGLLVALVAGRALGIVRQVPEGHGLEAWRCLVQEYEPEEPTRWCSMLRSLMKPAWSEASPFMDQLLEWERAIRVYETGSGHRVGEPMRCAIITGQAPSAVRNFLRLSPVDYAGDYAAMRAAIRAYLSKGRRYGDDGVPLAYDPVAMDVGAVWPSVPWKGKGEGKGKPGGVPWKGKGKGDSWRAAPPLGLRGQGQWGQQQGQSGQQQGPRGGCYTCGGPHRQLDCTKGKGKGKTQPKPTGNPDANIQCGKCRMWGHRRSNCRQVNVVETAWTENVPAPEMVGGLSATQPEERLALVAMVTEPEQACDGKVVSELQKLKEIMQTAEQTPVPADDDLAVEPLSVTTVLQLWKAMRDAEQTPVPEDDELEECRAHDELRQVSNVMPQEKKKKCRCLRCGSMQTAPLCDEWKAYQRAVLDERCQRVARGSVSAVEPIGHQVMEVEKSVSSTTPVWSLTGTEQLIMLDSGAFTHVCPVNFMPEIPMECSTPRPGGLTASGQSLICYGSKRVKLQVWGDVVMDVKFEVMDVARPLLSVGEMQRHGWNVHFGQHSYLEYGNTVIPLLRRGGLSYLAVKGKKSAAEWSPSMCEVLTEAAKYVKEPEVRERREGGLWHVVEYCCEEDSLLTEWFLRRGHTATRMGLPGWDLSTKAGVRRAVEEIRQQLAKGKKILLWAALPCTSWCTWQNVSEQHGVEARQKLEIARRHSLIMIRNFKFVLRKALELGGDDVIAAYEWPRAATGWRLPEIRDLVKILPHRCNFDGCQYGLMTTAGYVKKPWRVQTNGARLVEPLSRRCGGEHPHVSLRGAAAVKSGMYTSAMVRAIGRAVVGCGAVCPLEENIAQKVEEEKNQDEEAMKEADVEEEDEQESRPVVTWRAADKPTCQQRRCHEITHVPYAGWCEVCVRARGRDEAHRAKIATLGPPVVEIDYSFMKTAEPEDRLATVLLAIRKPCGYGFACVVRQKGRGDPGAVNSLLRWLHECGLGAGVIRLRSDSEVSIRAVANAVAALRTQGETMVEVTPVGSSSSLGAVERWSETLAGLTRTLLLDAGGRLGKKLMATSALFPWAVRHAAFVHNRYQVRMQGATAFEQVHRRVYRSALMPFASPVLLRDSDALELPKLEARWQRGLWLGRRGDSDEHLVGAVDGVKAGRSCKQLEEANAVEMLNEMRWTPWNQHATDTQEESVPVKPKPLTQPGTGQEHPANRRKAAKELHAFHAKCGRTTGCSACMYGPDGRSHSMACRARRRAWIDAGCPLPEAIADAPDEEQSEAADMDVGEPEIPSSSKRKADAGEQPGAVRPRQETKDRRRKSEEQLPSTRLKAKTRPSHAAKRARDPMLEEQWMAEEELARTASPMPGAVAVLTVDGPPWYDEYTGIELPEEEVNAAMQKEMGSVENFKVDTDVPEEEMRADQEGILVPARWFMGPGG